MTEPSEHESCLVCSLPHFFALPAKHHDIAYFLGKQDWPDAFYSFEPDVTLFDRDEERVVNATYVTVAMFFMDRLKSVFAGVAERSNHL